MMLKNMPSRHTLAVLALTFTSMSCGEDRPLPPSKPLPAQYVVAVDLSTSLTSPQRANHEALLRSLVSGLDFGDRLVLLKAHAKGVHDTSQVHTLSMPVFNGTQPLTKHKNALALTRGAADRRVRSVFQSEPVNGSDLFATLFTAGQVAMQTDSVRTVLVLLSDMLNCTPDLCIEERRDTVPGHAWIVARKQAGLVPALDSACVAVVGANASTMHGVRVRDFWQRYFEAAGARLDSTRYVHRATSPGLLRCD
jgi:hypothetical protein